MEFQLAMCSLFGRREPEINGEERLWNAIPGKQFGCKVCNTTDATPILLNDTVRAKGKVVPVQALRHEGVWGSECI
jgi:hypothetical protein